MKKTFIKPEARAMAMQTENIMQSSIGGGTGDAPTTAEAKRGSRVGGPITSTTFAWN